MRKILKSAMLIEQFKPYIYDEKRFLKVIDRVAALDYYQSIEIPLFFEKESQTHVRRIIADNDYCGVAYCVAYLDAKHLSLCSLEKENREEAVSLVIDAVKTCEKMGITYLGVPSGDDPGDALREESKSVLADSFIRIGKICREAGITILLEPMDRYAHKKKLFGPMDETCTWLNQIQPECPNVQIEWDSAHETLNGADLVGTVTLAGPRLGRMHLCSCITDPTHPCFGDLHMDIGQPPEFNHDGFLTVDLSTQYVKTAAALDDGPDIYLSVEVNSKPGDDMWHKEYTTRTFMQTVLDHADLHTF